MPLDFVFNCGNAEISIEVKFRAKESGQVGEFFRSERSTLLDLQMSPFFVVPNNYVLGQERTYGRNPSLQASFTIGQLRSVGSGKFPSILFFFLLIDFKIRRHIFRVGCGIFRACCRFKKCLVCGKIGFSVIKFTFLFAKTFIFSWQTVHFK